MTRLFRADTAFFLVIWLMLLFAFRERGFIDPGSLWHIKVGEIILTKGMPETDPFTYTFAGEKWVPQQWGAEVLMALAHRVGGFETMLLAFATGIAALFTLIFQRCLRSGMGVPLAALIVAGTLFVGAFHYYVRPHMFTIALLAWTMMCIVDYERGRCSLWRLAGLIPLFILWTNLHGGVLGGTMTLGLAVGGWGLLFLVRDGRPQPATSAPTPIENPPSPIHDWPTAFILVAIVAGCFFSPLVNPHGFEMLRIWQRIVESKVMPEIIIEHMPMNPTAPLGLAVIGLGVFYLALLFGTLPARPHVSWLLPLVWFVLSFKGIRQGPLFAITAAVTIADMWPHTIWHRLLVKHGDGSLARDPKPDEPAPEGGPWWVVPCAAVLFAFVLQVAQLRVPLIGADWVRLDPAMMPSDITPKVKEVLDHPGTRVFNDMNLGGYLIYHAPHAKIFMDDRCELYGDEWLRSYYDAMHATPETLGSIFEGWSERYRFEYAMIETTEPDKKLSAIERYLLSKPDKWVEVARGKSAILFERK